MYKLATDQAEQERQQNKDAPSKITEDLVMYYTDCRRLSDVQVVALRDRNIHSGFDVLSQCTTLQVAFLQNNHLTTDLHHLGKMSRLVKLNLSFNNIILLPPKENLVGLKSLRLFFLDHNNIQKWRNLESLTAIQSLYHLTLLNNPIVQTPGYRHYMVTKISGLKALDDYIITDEERMDDVGHGVRFKAMSQFMRLYAPDFKEGLTAEQHVFQVDLEIYKLKRLFEKNSPSIRIQALFKGYKKRVAQNNYFQKRGNSIVYIQKMVRGWLQRLKVKRDLRRIMKEQGLEELVMSQQELQYHLAYQKLRRPMIKFMRRCRIKNLRNKMALKIQRTWRMYRLREYSFISALELEKYPVLYYLKEQRIRFNEMISQTCKKLKNSFDPSDIQKNFVSQGCEFYTYRYPDYTEFPYKKEQLLHSLMPSMKAKMLPNRQNQLFPKTKRSIKYLMCQFGPDSGTFEREKLEKLKPRQGGVDFQSMHEEVHKRNDKYDRYQDFDTLFFPNMQFAKTLIKIVKNNNMNNQGKQILLFYKLPLTRVSAAVTIQTTFRHYRWRKYMPHSYKFSLSLIKNRAALCMQAWWRSIKLTRRIKFLSTLKGYLHKIDSNVIYMEETMYLELPRIIHELTEKSTRLAEQFIAFAFEPNTRCILIRNLKIERFEQDLVPNWVLDDKTPNALVTEEDGVYQSHNFPMRNLILVEQLFINDLMGVFHFTDGHNVILNNVHDENGNQVQNQGQVNTDTQVKDFNQIVNYRVKSIDLQKGLKFVEIRCGSVQEAKKRALIISLLTFFFKQQYFVRFFTQRQLEEGFFLQTLKDMWIAYDIDFQAIEEQYKIKQFGELSYNNQIRDKNFALSEDKDRILAEFLIAQQAQCNLESHTIKISSQHHQVPDRVIQLVQPRSFFSGSQAVMGLVGKFENLGSADASGRRYSNLEDGFSSRNTEAKALPGGLSIMENQNQSQNIEIDIKVKIAGGMTGSKKQNAFLTKRSTDQVANVTQQQSPFHMRVLSSLGNKDTFDQSYLDPKPYAGNMTTNDFTQNQTNSQSLLQTQKKVKEYIENINQQLTETKKQEISQIRDFRQYVKLIGNELQQQQLQEFIQFKHEQKSLITTFLTREKDRKLFENLNKRLNSIELDHHRKKKKDDIEFSKQLTAQMTMLNRVNIQTMRKKEIKKNVIPVGVGAAKAAAETNKMGFGIKGGMHPRHNSQQVSPRDKKLKMIDLNDAFLMQDSQHLADYHLMPKIKGPKTSVWASARPSIDQKEKYASLIRQYEKNHEMTDSLGHLKSHKELMIFDESVQLPAFPKKITRNAMERSYMKRIINVKMHEFSPMNQINKNNKNMFPMNSHNNESFLLTNSYSGGFPMVQSRGNTSHINTNVGDGAHPIMPNELSLIAPSSPGPNAGELLSTIHDDSLYKPSLRDITLAQENSIAQGNVSLMKASVMQNSKDITNVTSSHADEPTTFRTGGGGGSTARQYIPPLHQFNLNLNLNQMFTGGNSVHMPHGTARAGPQNSPIPNHMGYQNQNLSVRNNIPAVNGMATKESHHSLSKNVQSSSIWDYNEDQKSSRKKIVMPLSKALS